MLSTSNCFTRCLQVLTVLFNNLSWLLDVEMSDMAKLWEALPGEQAWLFGQLGIMAPSSAKGNEKEAGI